MRIIFDSIKRSQKCNYVCISCGKKRTKIITEEKTVNPFNKIADGSRAKNHDEVLQSVQKELRESVEEFNNTQQTCTKC